MVSNDVRTALSNPMRKALDDFDLRTGPTVLELSAGSPNSIEGLTETARQLKAFANNMKILVKEVGDTHFRVHSDATLTEAGRLTRSAEFAKHRINDSRARFGRLADPGFAELNRLHETLKTKLKAPASAGEAAIDSELRAWVKSQKVTEALNAARSSVEVMAAVSRAPHVLSGLNPEAHKNIKEEYLAKVDPEIWGQANDLGQALKTANEALGYLESEAKTLIDFETAEKLESRRVAA